MLDLMRVMLDHPRSAIVGVSSIFKFRLDPIYSFRDIAICIFSHFGLKLLIQAHFRGGVWGHIPPNMVPIVLTPKRTILAQKHVVWAIKRENRSSGSTWAHDRENKGQDRTGQSKKSQCGNISPIWGEAPTSPIEAKICMVGYLADVITCAKFQDDIFRGYDFTGDLISDFPIYFCMGLTTVQRDCAACDRVAKFAYSRGFSEIADRMAWPPFFVTLELQCSNCILHDFEKIEKENLDTSFSCYIHIWNM